MTQGKKKKRAANRSIMLAKKIIIKDGGTVSRGYRAGEGLAGPGSLSAPCAAPCGRPWVPSALPTLPRCRCLGLPGPRASAPGAFLSSPRPAASGPVLSDGEAARLSRTCRPLRRRPRRPCGPEPPALLLRGQGSTPGSVAGRPTVSPGRCWCRPLPPAVQAPRPGAVPALPYAANGVASGAATPAGPGRALALSFPVLGRCSCPSLPAVR